MTATIPAHQDPPATACRTEAWRSTGSSRFVGRLAAAALGLLTFLCVLSLSGPKTVDAADARERYIQAEKTYRELRQAPEKQKYRRPWLNCIQKFEAVYRLEPDGPWAAAGLFMSGTLYRELHRHSFREADLKEAADIFHRILKRYPKSQYARKARVQLETLEKPKAAAAPAEGSRKAEGQGDTIGRLIAQAAAPAPAPSETRSAATGQARVENLRYWSNNRYTRVVIDVSRETAFQHHLLKKDPALKKPQRLYIDLDHSRLGGGLQKTLPINDNLLNNVRAGQYTAEAVRVVVDIKSFDRYKIFSLRNPYRIVIDVWGDADGSPSPVQLATPGGSTPIPAGALAKQLALGVRRIIIDPGHGGKDYGAPGYLKGVYEKDIVLAVGKKLAQKLREELNCEVIMTRSTDKYLTLEERTAIANTKNADLFISIHTNAHRDRNAYGVETYFLNLATDDEAILVAARENATSTKNISDLQSILNDLMQNAKINESSRLAGYVQNDLTGYLGKRYPQVKSKGVKQAPFYVLLGAQMPAILVETSFISNPRECKRLTNPAYQEHLCDGIVQGIRRYIRETTPTAFRGQPQPSGAPG
ncbi:MAG: N-acetylmuramoyl-L-alanine amidase [Desulfobacterales bacterium]